MRHSICGAIFATSIGAAIGACPPSACFLATAEVASCTPEFRQNRSTARVAVNNVRVREIQCGPGKPWLSDPPQRRYLSVQREFLYWGSLEEPCASFNGEVTKFLPEWCCDSVMPGANASCIAATRTMFDIPEWLTWP